MKKTFRAQYNRQGTVIRTKFYPSREAAQDALAKRVGYFHHLGRVSGDAFETDGRGCIAAPRNGGLVSIESKDAQEGK